MPEIRKHNSLGHCEGRAACKVYKMERFLACCRGMEALGASNNVFT